MAAEDQIPAALLHRLVTAAWEARERAHAPYSGFRVGAALDIAGADPVVGCNVENAALNVGLCAERVALFTALSSGQVPGAWLVVVTDSHHPTPPCGACRQALRELAPDTGVLSVTRAGAKLGWPPGELLPARGRSPLASRLVPQEIVALKRDGRTLTAAQIDAFIRGLIHGEVEEYQMTAFLMAVFLRGMGRREIRDLTAAMLASGTRLEFADVSAPRIDKHSTGGVGDKVSLALLPLAVAAGVRVPMISGRGLGHTGGTLDKLEAIPGYRTTLPISRLRELIARPGGFIAGQTHELVPADRVIYALRDVSATVASIPLIVSSILSKKLAAGLTGLVLDVKFGRGAFMSDRRSAERLARTLVEVAGTLDLPAVALLTRMDEPLGCAVGNALEVRETLSLLAGNSTPRELRELTLALSGLVLALGGRAPTMAAGARECRDLLASGAAQETARAWIAAQGGDPEVVDRPELLEVSSRTRVVSAAEDGYVQTIDARRAGELCVRLGGGRRRSGDPIDHRVGLLFHRTRGERVRRGEPLYTIYLPEDGSASDWLAEEESGMVRIGPAPPAPYEVIAALVTAAGVCEEPADFPVRVAR